MEKIELEQKLSEIENDMKFNLLDHSDEEEDYKIFKKESEPIRIIFLGANNTYKSLIVSKILNTLNDKNNINFSDCETKKFCFQLEVEPSCDIEKIKKQNVEIYDCPGSNYYELISKIEKNLKMKSDSIIFNYEEEINSLHSQALNNIREYYEEIITCFNLRNSQFDIYVLTFDNLLSWTLEEAKL
jgi:hypothetical protein